MSNKRRQVAIMVDLDWAYRHHLDVFSGTQAYAKRRGDWDVIVDPHADGTLPARGKQSPYDGIIARATRQLQQRAARLGVPVVNVWVNSPAASLPSVIPDFAGSGRLAAEHLLLRGLRRFGYFGFRREQAIRPQFEAFRDVADEAGCQVTSLFLNRTYAKNAANWAVFQNELRQWLDTWQPPVGVLTSFDLLGRYLASACRRRGWRVPEDVAIIGTGDEMSVCVDPAPSLSSINLGYDQVGFCAAQLLERLMDGGPPPQAPVRVPPRGLVARRSTDIYAVDDPTVAAALHFISENSGSDIKVDDIAAAASTTRRTLERRFREVLDRSINEELNRLRLERAKRCLTQSDVSITAIAVECGFGSTTQMGLVFRRLEGISPREYRQSRVSKKERPFPG